MRPRLERHELPGNNRAARYFARLGDAYAVAAGRCSEQSFDLLVGQSRLRASFASEELAFALMPALERLLAPASGPPKVWIRSWDSASTGVPVAPFQWSAADIGPGGSVAGYDDDRFRTLYRDDGSGFHSLSMFDPDEGVGYVWFGNHARINWYERAEPLRAAVHWALTTDQCYLAHASAVGDERGALLLTGKGGAGKTTTTLASIEAGLRFVGDNYVLLSLEHQPEVYGLYGNAKLWPETLECFPTLRPYVSTFDVAADEKLVVDVARYCPERLAERLPVRAVVVTEVTGAAAARLVRCTPVETLLALAPTTILQLPKTDRGLSGMSQLVRRVPTFKLELGQEMMSGPRALSGLLDEVGG